MSVVYVLMFALSIVAQQYGPYEYGPYEPIQPYIQPYIPDTPYVPDGPYGPYGPYDPEPYQPYYNPIEPIPEPYPEPEPYTPYPDPQPYQPDTDSTTTTASTPVTTGTTTGTYFGNTPASTATTSVVTTTAVGTTSVSTGTTSAVTTVGTTSTAAQTTTVGTQTLPSTPADADAGTCSSIVNSLCGHDGTGLCDGDGHCLAVVNTVPCTDGTPCYDAAANLGMCENSKCATICNGGIPSICYTPTISNGRCNSNACESTDRSASTTAAGVANYAQFDISNAAQIDDTQQHVLLTDEQPTRIYSALSEAQNLVYGGMTLAVLSVGIIATAPLDGSLILTGWQCTAQDKE